MTRAGTVPPTGFRGWLQELASIAATVVFIGLISYMWHRFHVRKSTAMVEVSDCTGNVVFVDGDQRWTYAAGSDCVLYRVGDRWLISWNMDGMVEPVRRR